MNYEEACSMADNYCQRMDEIRDLYQIELMQTEMMLDFCCEVAKLRNKGKTALILECCDYIHKNTHSKILLEDLTEVAKACHYMKS